MNLNKVLLIGRLAADPETRNTPSGQLVATVRIATNRTWNDQAGNKQEQTEFHTVVVWGKLAEIAQKYMQKGQLVHFEGRLQTRSWQGNDGVKRYATEVVAEGLQLGPRATGAGFTAGGTGTAAHAPTANAAKPAWSAPKPMSQKAHSSSPEEDIPVINEDSPVSNPILASNDMPNEVEIDLKDIPF